MNINEHVWVKLTPWGVEALAKYIAQFPVGAVSFVKEYGHVRFQMHELMKIFGPYSYVGGEVCFEENSISFEAPKAPPPRKYHVVLKRVYNVIVDQVEASSELEAIKNAEIHCDTLVRSLSNIEITDRVHLDDGDDPVSALVDTYTEGGDCYEEESFYEFDGNRNEYTKKD